MKYTDRDSRLWPANVVIALCSLALCLSTTTKTGEARAGEFNEVLSIGDMAPAWTDLPGADHKNHSLADLKEKKAVVVVFTCASCPTARDYEDRINALSANSEIAVVAICVNQVKEDLLPALTERVQERKLGFTYLHDASQNIAKEYGAVYTPEFYVLNAERKIVYMGAFDDSTAPEKVTKRYVEDAVKSALAGKRPEVKEVIARGCRVRYARERRGNR